MKNKKKKIIMSLIIIAILTTGSIFSYNKYQNYQKTNPNATIAVVNKQKIKRNQLQPLINQTETNLKTIYHDDYLNNDTAKHSLEQAKQNSLEELIQEEILKQKANESNMSPSNDDIDKYVNSVKEEYKKSTNGSDNDYENYIKSKGYTDESFEQALITNFIANKEINEITKNIDVTNSEIENYYNTNKKNLNMDAGAFITSIAIPITANENSDKNAKDLIQKAKNMLDSGEKMENIVKIDEFKNANAMYSEPMHITFDNTQINADILKSFKNLKENQYSDIIQTSSVYTIILKTNTNTGKTIPSLENLKYQIKNTILQNKKDQILQNVINDYKNSIKIKIYNNRL